MLVMPADPAVLRRSLNAVAMQQAGYFTAAQALELGYSYQSQKYHVDHGNWDRVDRGLFRLPGWPTRDEDYYVFWRLWSRDLAVVSHQSALAVYDLGDVNPARFHLTVPPGFRAKDPAVILHRAILAPGDVEDRDGYQITSVQRTLFDVAAGDMSQEQLDVSISDAVERGLVTPRRLQHRADEFGSRAALRIERALTALKSQSLCPVRTSRPRLSVRHSRRG
jgi:predicted transcriptional regulator of viral defense system